jgi:hypothetical protein
MVSYRDSFTFYLHGISKLCATGHDRVIYLSELQLYKVRDLPHDSQELEVQINTNLQSSVNNIGIMAGGFLTEKTWPN